MYLPQAGLSALSVARKELCMLPEYKSVVEVLRRGGKGGDVKGAKANMERVINITSSIGRNSEMHHAAVRRYIYTTPHFFVRDKMLTIFCTVSLWHI
jgi:hypothetical protein